ncbi:hypothetical protein EGJ23_01400 [Pseudomonas sp. o96-267]|nr:hypothetical protein EGJ23_01400 [Pseudomonas sp. o96-267]
MSDQKSRNKTYYQENAERLRAEKLAYYHANKEACQARSREYHKTYKRPELSSEKREEINRKRREKYANDPNHREKLKKQAKSWARQTPEKKRASRLKSEYRLEQDEYQAMLESQGGACAICGAQSTGVREKGKRERSLSVDHCHTTGKVRGLLCHNCNFGIGHFKDNPDLLRIAMAYLIKSSSGAT